MKSKETWKCFSGLSSFKSRLKWIKKLPTPNAIGKSSGLIFIHMHPLTFLRYIRKHPWSRKAFETRNSSSSYFIWLQFQLFFQYFRLRFVSTSSSCAVFLMIRECCLFSMRCKKNKKSRAKLIKKVFVLVHRFELILGLAKRWIWSWT